MDAPEPDSTPFAAVSAQTTKIGRVCSFKLRRYWQIHMGDFKLTAIRALALPILPRQGHTVYHISLDRDRGPPLALFPPNTTRPRLVHR